MNVVHTSVSSLCSAALNILGILLLVCTMGLGQTLPNGARSFQSDLSAASAGILDAQLRVAKAYYFGMGTRRDYGQALEWFEAASRQNSSEATAWLGNCLIFGKGTKQDIDRGVKLIQSAADQGNATGLRMLGILYQTGRGVTQDLEQAFALFSRAAALNDPRSFERLGNLYLHGKGTSRDVGKAKEMFERGAALGDSWAELSLGDLYQQGGANGGQPDYKTALRLYVQSAAQKNRIACFRAGKLYELGRISIPDQDKAVQYYRKSAELGFAPAEEALAELHEKLGDSTNLAYAYAFYTVAANHGNVDANERLAALTEKLNANELNQGAKILARWRRTIANANGGNNEDF